MRPLRILIFAATTVLSTLAGYALLMPVRPNLIGSPGVTSIASIPRRAEMPIALTTQAVSRTQGTIPVLHGTPRVITEIQYVEAPAPKASPSSANRERDVEQSESGNDHDD
jgi:hypothetical protein